MSELIADHSELVEAILEVIEFEQEKIEPTQHMSPTELAWACGERHGLKSAFIALTDHSFITGIREELRLKLETIEQEHTV